MSTGCRLRLVLGVILRLNITSTIAITSHIRRHNHTITRICSNHHRNRQHSSRNTVMGRSTIRRALGGSGRLITKIAEVRTISTMEEAAGMGDGDCYLSVIVECLSRMNQRADEEAVPPNSVFSLRVVQTRKKRNTTFSRKICSMFAKN